jgi:hypothetical protein
MPIQMSFLSGIFDVIFQFLKETIQINIFFIFSLLNSY